jgi:RNA recognition motif-containing protein
LKEKDMGDGRKLYLRHAMKKYDRDLEKKKEIIRYKTSKKRCNLYVKNFPLAWTHDDLEQLFKEYGPIERIKLQTGSRSGNFAFVCYLSPDHATAAR